MPTHFAFRLSMYITLGLACACLCYAEWSILRQASFFGGFVILLLVVAFLCEGKYELDITSANRLGFGIGLASVAWLAYQFVNRDSLIYTLPWPTSLLPYLGPLLMVLMPAKLFRPKHIGDWWAMQGIGLATACLATAMEADAAFGVLLFLYGISGVWSLSLFFYLRMGGLLPPVPHTDPGPPVTILASTIRVEETQFGRAFLGRALVWVGLAAAFALPLFLITPRSNAPKWTFGVQRVETGLGNENYSDLNRTGDLTPSNEVAFEFTVTDRNGERVVGFNPDQRFRSTYYNAYENGRWLRTDTQPILMTTARLLRDDITNDLLVDLGPGQIELTFSSKIRLAEPTLADPVPWLPNKPSPIITLVDQTLRPWLHFKDGQFRPFSIPSNRGLLLPYRQSFVEAAEPGLGPPWEPMIPYQPLGTTTDPDSLWFVFRNHKLTKLKAWSRDLCQRLAKENPVIKQALDRAVTKPQFQFLPQDFEAVARVVSQYFATSPEYEYSLKLRRVDKSLDPIEEFVFEVKEGHCQRFAAATAIVLRSLGIPTAYVLGFRGCVENPDFPGSYAISQDMAHAWVEVAIPRPAPPGFEFRRNPPDELGGQPIVWHWLSLDPTPSGDPPATAKTTTDMINDTWSILVNFFADYIVGYNPEKRQAALQSIMNWFLGPVGQGIAWTSLLGTSTLVYIWYRRRRISQRQFHSGFTWYDAYLAVVDRLQLGLSAGLTDREIAHAIQLRTGSDAPCRLVELYYQAKYAKRELAPDELAQAEAWITQVKNLPKNS